MTTTPNEPSPDPTVVPSGDPGPESAPEPEPGEDPGVAPAPEVDPDSSEAAPWSDGRPGHVDAVATIPDRLRP